ncbi:MAG: polysaccharide biosynthesis protein PslG [Solirubrobacteraceae bacterium]|nr:polysaccharide biosynthesis protein PslG [Solirubrobacteraceae bacterium]
MRLVTSALCCIAVALACAPAARAADPFYGVFTRDMSHSAAQLGAELDAQAATGVGSLREHLHWDRIERSAGVFDFTDTDALVAGAGARGMTLLPVLIDTPQFYSTRPAGEVTSGWPPRDPAAIRRLSYELARRYGTGGTYWGCLAPGLLCRRPYHPITAWEVWNEPDIVSWWRPGVSADAYTALLQQAYEGLKTGDSAAEVVLAGLTFRAVAAGAYLDQLYTAGAASYFDALAIHPYAVNVGGVVDIIRRTRAIANARGDVGVPIRITEYGFATGGKREWVTDPPCQAALIAAATRELFARRGELGVRAITQFQWLDSSDSASATWPNFAGMLYLDGRFKPAVQAFTDAVAGRLPPADERVAAVCGAQHQG